MLTVSKITKSYGALRALDGVSAEFREGEIHAVLGENGAGKSTLMNLLAGFTKPDSGSIKLDGKELPVGRPFECKRLGIAMIHQHFTLVPGFTVEENLALAAISGPGPIDSRELSKPAMAQAEALGWPLDLAAKTGQLPVGAQQRIEILKALSGESRVIIFDEPTAVLSQGEVEDLFRVLRALKQDGKTVILIAHKLREVMAVADRVTVLRRGKVVGEAPIGQVTSDRLVEWMVGEIPPLLQKNADTKYREGLRATGLSAKGDRGERALHGIDLEARRGEILGIGGVDGNGQVELAEVFAGVRSYGGGLEWEGRPFDPDSRSPRIAYIPQDRQHDGLALGMSIEDNMLIEGHRRPSLTAGPFIRRQRLRQWSSGLIERFDIKTGSAKARADSLSGGNQQKLVVARALDEVPDLLVAVNPGRGLDVKATEYVHRKILDARNAGAAVVLVSTDLDEIGALATRTLYLSRGQIVEGEGAAALVGGAG